MSVFSGLRGRARTDLKEPEAPPAKTADADVPAEDDNDTVDLGRLAWIVTVAALTVTVLILCIDGYYGYAGVTLAVALSAAINLF